MLLVLVLMNLQLFVRLDHQCSRRVSLFQTFAAAAVEREVTTASRGVMRLRDDAEVCSGL